MPFEWRRGRWKSPKEKRIDRQGEAKTKGCRDGGWGGALIVVLRRGEERS